MKDFFSPIISFMSRQWQRREMKKKGLIQTKKKKRLKHEESFATVAEKSKTLGILILFVVWGACVAVLVANPYSAMEFPLVLKQKALTTIYADLDFSYINEEKSGERQKEIRKAEPLIYRLDYGICEKSKDKAGAIFDSLLMTDGTTSPAKIEGEFPVSENTFNALSPGLKSAMMLILKNQELKGEILDNLEEALYHGVFTPEQREERFGQKLKIYKGKGKELYKEKTRFVTSIQTPSEVAEEVAANAVSKSSPANRTSLKRVFATILTEIITGNLVYDNIQTEINRDKTAYETPEVIVNVKKDDIVVKKGKVVDKETLVRCNAYFSEKNKLNSPNSLRRKFVTSALLCLFLIVVSGLYISHVHPEIVESNQKMGLIATVIVIAVVINYLSIGTFYRLKAVFGFYPQLASCVLPIALSSIILSAMIGLRVAFFSGLFVSIIAAMQLNNSFIIVITGMVVCGISAFSVRHRINYKSYFLASFGVIAITMPIMNITASWFLPNFFDILPHILFYGILNGIVTALGSLVIISILEWVFQVTSDMTLLLLCDYNHILLKRLQMEAPGTYHHSMVVSTLAEHAAQSIGANPIKARVIALFHDVGKMVKPDYFTENQQSDENKHKKLNSRMSCLVILNHTKEGIDMALKHKLRKIIRDGIEQHHGTDTVYYFYQQALEEARHKGESVDEHDFKYPGPLPKEKEVVILSLADPCEAASRSLQKPTPAKIDALVWEIFRKRIRDGQLDNADLTFSEIKKIRESFVLTLSTMMHGRISYPKDLEDDDEGDLFVATQKRNKKT